VDLDEHLQHMTDIEADLLILNSSVKSLEEMCLSNKTVQEGQLLGCMATLKIIDGDITVSANLQKIFSLPISHSTPENTSNPVRVYHSLNVQLHPILQTGQYTQSHTIGARANEFPAKDESSELNELSRKIQVLNHHLASCKQTA